MRYFLRPGTIQSYNHAGDTAPASTSESSSFEAPNYEEHGYLRSPAISTTLGSTSRLPNKSPALPNTPTLTGTANRRTLAHYQSAIRLKANVEKSLKEARATMQFWRRKAREDMDFIMTPSTSKASSVGSDSADAQDHLTPARRAAVEALLARYRAQTEARSSHSSPDEDSESFSDDLTLDSIRFVAGATSDELASIFTSETAVSGALSAICDLLSIDGVIQSDEEEHTSRTPSPTRSGSSGTTISACEPASRIPLSTRSRGYSLGSVNSSTPIKGTATATPTRTGNQEAGRSKLASPPRSRSIAASRTYRQSEDFTPIPDTPSPASRASTLPSVPALTSTPPRQAPASRLRRPTVSSALKAVDSPAPAQNFSGTANSPQVRTRKSSLSTGTGFLPRAAYAASSLPTRSHVQAPLSPIRFADAPSPPRAVSSLSARPTVSFSGRRSSTSLSSRPATSLDKPVPSTSCSPGPSITNKPVLTTPSKPPPSTPNRPASSLNGRSRAPSFGAAAPPRPHTSLARWPIRETPPLVIKKKKVGATAARGVRASGISGSDASGPPRTTTHGQVTSALSPHSAVASASRTSSSAATVMPFKNPKALTRAPAISKTRQVDVMRGGKDKVCEEGDHECGGVYDRRESRYVISDSHHAERDGVSGRGTVSAIESEVGDEEFRRTGVDLAVNRAQATVSSLRRPGGTWRHRI